MRPAGFTQLSPLGAGAFGQVVLARHDGSGTIVAIKVLHDQQPAARAWFRHEAAMLQRVVSPHVARLYEFIEQPDGAAIVMEAVPGVPLTAVLAEGALSAESALTVLKGSLLGLAAAHQVGAVHRDYKPGNVLVQPNHQSKLVDFGVAVLAGQSGEQAGTPNYMAPEQWAGAPATPATDVYAATCVFFRCVTGHLPFAGDLRQAHEHAPVPLDAVPESLRPLIAHGMAKHPAQRPPTAWQFVAWLDSLAAAGYGPDWERRGWEQLAGKAATLLSLTPLAALAGAGVSGAMAGSAAGTGMAAGTGAAAAANTAVAGTVGAAATSAGTAGAGLATGTAAGAGAGAAGHIAVAGTVGAGATSAGTAGAAGAAGLATGSGTGAGIAAGTAGTGLVAGSSAATGMAAAGTPAAAGAAGLAAGSGAGIAAGTGAGAAGTGTGAAGTGAGAAGSAAIAGTVGAGATSAGTAGAAGAAGLATGSGTGAGIAAGTGTGAGIAAGTGTGAGIAAGAGAGTAAHAAGTAGTGLVAGSGAATGVAAAGTPAAAAGAAGLAAGTGTGIAAGTGAGAAANIAVAGTGGAGVTGGAGSAGAAGAGLATGGAAGGVAAAGTPAATAGAGLAAGSGTGIAAGAGAAANNAVAGATTAAGGSAAGAAASGTAASGAAASGTAASGAGIATGASATGAATGGAVGGGAATGAATAGGVGATAIAAKVVIGVIAAAAVAGTTVVVVNAASGDPAAPAAPGVTATAQSRTQDFSNFTFNGQVVQVTGIADKGIATKVNEVLAKPVDDWIAYTKNGIDHSTGSVVPPAASASSTSKAQIVGQTDHFVSVRYDLLISDAGDAFGNHGGYQAVGMTVDLSTGTQLTTAQAFPHATAPDGAAMLDAAFTKNAPQGFCQGMESSPRTPMQPEFLDNDYVQIMFAQDGVQFLLYPPAFGYAMACDQAVVKVPYADVKPLMDPRAVALIPGG